MNSAPGRVELGYAPNLCPPLTDKVNPVRSHEIGVSAGNQRMCEDTRCRCAYLCEWGLSIVLPIERANSTLSTSKLGVNATIIPSKNQWYDSMLSAQRVVLLLISPTELEL
jgi:hypothetical protein